MKLGDLDDPDSSIVSTASDILPTREEREASDWVSENIVLDSLEEDKHTVSGTGIVFEADATPEVHPAVFSGFPDRKSIFAFFYQ